MSKFNEEPWPVIVLPSGKSCAVILQEKGPHCGFIVMQIRLTIPIRGGSALAGWRHPKATPVDLLLQSLHMMKNGYWGQSVCIRITDLGVRKKILLNKIDSRLCFLSENDVRMMSFSVLSKFNVRLRPTPSEDSVQGLRRILSESCVGLCPNPEKDSVQILRRILLKS